MNKLLVAVALAGSVVSTGCFTAAGAVIGSQVKNRDARQMSDGSVVTVETRNVLAGAVLGAMLDLASLAIVSQLDYPCFSFGPGQSMDDC